MSDIDKIKILHDFKNTFSIDRNSIAEFIDQLGDNTHAKVVERFFSGYTVEDNFAILFSAIPWVKLIHGLNQKQMPGLSKEMYQVPDYFVFYETKKAEAKPLLIEVKSVSGNKQGLEIMNKQLFACVEYSKILNLTLLYAVYWEKYQLWTFNSVESFDKNSKKHKITIFQAVKNDFSVILGDITLFVNRPIFRKTIFDASVSDLSMPHHMKFGAVISDSISIDSEEYIEIEYVGSAILDSCILMKIVETKKDGSITTIVEKSSNNLFLKLSTVILRYLAVFGIELNEKNAHKSTVFILEFFKKIHIPYRYSVPDVKTPTSDFLYKQAFEGSFIYEEYLTYS